MKKLKALVLVFFAVVALCLAAGCSAALGSPKSSEQQPTSSTGGSTSGTTTTTSTGSTGSSGSSSGSTGSSSSSGSTGSGSTGSGSTGSGSGSTGSGSTGSGSGSTGSGSTGSGSGSTGSGSGSTGSGSGSGSTTSSALPTPPANAKVFTEIQATTGWQTCSTASCAGGSGNGASWMAANQSTPSLDGSSMELFNSGVWANTLWWQKVGSNNSATNFLWDFYAQVDDASLQGAQALEFDSFQFIAGYNYMFGSQCDLGAGKWDVWDELNGQWIHTTIPCKQFAPDVWHHIQWYIQRNSNATTYTFVTLVVDGTPYTVNQTYSAKNLGWSDNLGVQYQLDVNASGTGYHEWIDRSTLTIW